jgi:hypothetical protein
MLMSETHQVSKTNLRALFHQAIAQQAQGLLRREVAMLNLRRFAAAALLVGAAMVPTLAAAPAYVVGLSAAAVPVVPADWVLIGTYPDVASCDAAAASLYPGNQYQCLPSSGGFDLYVWL